MSFLRNLQINALLTAIVYILLGLLFILLPDAVVKYLALIVGITLAVAGIAYIIGYFRKWDIEYRSNGLAIGILLLFGVLFLLLQSNVVAEIIPLLLGFAVIISGAIKLQNAIVLIRSKISAWIPVLVLAIVCFTLGIFIMLNPFAALRALIVFIGISLLLSGLTDLVIIFIMSRQVAKLQHTAKSAPHAPAVPTDAAATPIPDEASAAVPPADNGQ